MQLLGAVAQNMWFSCIVEHPHRLTMASICFRSIEISSLFLSPSAFFPKKNGIYFCTLKSPQNQTKAHEKNQQTQIKPHDENPETQTKTLSTITKAFCSCPYHYGSQPNTSICPICMGLPGPLLVLNPKVIEFAVKLGLA